MLTYIFTSVFHRILDFKTGLNFYSDPFFYALPYSTQRSASAGWSFGFLKMVYILGTSLQLRKMFCGRSISFYGIKNKAAHTDSLYTYQPKNANPVLFFFFSRPAFLDFFDLSPDLGLYFCRELGIIVQ